MQQDCYRKEAILSASSPEGLPIGENEEKVVETSADAFRPSQSRGPDESGGVIPWDKVRFGDLLQEYQEVCIMCGIVGYVGDKQAAEFLLEGLSKLEYRGYDSAGIAVYDDKSYERYQERKREMSTVGDESHQQAFRFFQLTPLHETPKRNRAVVNILYFPANEKDDKSGLTGTLR